MEKYKERIRKRLLINGLSTVALGCMLMFMGQILPLETETHDLGFASGVIMGMLTAGAVLMLFEIGRILGALKNEKYLRQMYIKENDERTKLIYNKIGGDYAQIQSMVQLIAGAGIVFFGYAEAGIILFGITCLEVIARLIMKLYYRKTL